MIGLRSRCDKLAETLAGVADGSVVLDADEQAHVDACLRCQADLVQYRRVLRAMRAMRTEVLRPPPGLLADIVNGLEAAGERQVLRSIITGRRVAYIGGIAAATAAGAAGALIAARSRDAS